MNETSDRSPSFDPRTWAARPGETPKSPEPAPDIAVGAAPEGAGAAGSFDPKTWSRPAAGPPPPPASDEATRPLASRRALIFAGAGAVAAAGLGIGFLALSHRGPGKSAAGAQTPEAAPQGLAAGSAVRRSLEVSGPADVQRALVGNGVSASEASAGAEAALKPLANAAGPWRLVFIVAPGKTELRLVSLEVRLSDGSGVIVSRGSGDSFVARPVASNLASGVRVIRSEMDANSFYTSAVAAGIPDTLISPFSNAFSYDFDFQREVKQGDIFEAAFSEKVNDRGEQVGAPELLYVLMETSAKSRALYRYKPANAAEAGWYDANGSSVVRSFLRTPVESARVSSTFGMRMHPVLGFEKMHKGVDFAAPIGTPIYAAGDGVVQFAAMKGPNGNIVILQHDNGWQTYYLHMVKIGDGITPGVRVRQGQQIGQVGMTGRATGPHLHYEVHINNEAVDPMGIHVEAAAGLTGAVLADFVKERNRIDALRQAQNG